MAEMLRELIHWGCEWSIIRFMEAIFLNTKNFYKFLTDLEGIFDLEKFFVDIDCF